FAAAPAATPLSPLSLHDALPILLAEVSAKALPRESMPLAHLARVLGDGHLEHGLRHVDRDRRRIHRAPPSKGLLDARRLWHTMPFKSREESIPSLELERPGMSG